MISVFTPTHDARHLHDAHRSLVNQKYTDWEWVIVPNGTAMIPSEIRDDPRVRIAPDPSGMKGAIGALKRFACAKCRGEIFVELDHDDMLHEDCLSQLIGAFDRGAGFVYSDFVMFLPDHGSYAPDDWKASGWQFYPTEWRGRTYLATRAFEANAASLASGATSPNHVRAWSREAYYAAGGHDPDLAIADDYDLVCRTYLSGAVFSWVQAPLYWYRYRWADDIEDANTHVARHDENQDLAQKVSNKYFLRIAEEWCRREKLDRWDMRWRKDDIQDAPDGFQPIVLSSMRHHGEARRFGYVPDEKIGIIRAFDCLQFVPRDEIVEIMWMFWSMLAPGGWLMARVPSTDGRGAFQDPRNVSWWNSNSWWYYTQADFARLLPDNKARFQLTRQWDGAQTQWHADRRIIYTNADLCAIKGQRMPGVQLI